MSNKIASIYFEKLDAGSHDFALGALALHHGTQVLIAVLAESGTIRTAEFVTK